MKEISEKTWEAINGESDSKKALKELKKVIRLALNKHQSDGSPLSITITVRANHE